MVQLKRFSELLPDLASEVNSIHLVSALQNRHLLKMSVSVEKWSCYSEFLFKEHLTRSLNSFDQELLHVKNIVENLDRIKKGTKI